MSGRVSSLLLALSLLIALLAVQTIAAPQRTIVLHGARGGSHLQLSLAGGELRARGAMGAPPVGCRVTRAHRAASCPLEGIDQVEVEMGPAGDRVEVLDRLPLPLTVHLGGGSDRFLGNGEADTCYSEGSRRNRCIGGGGNDACITGDQNSDCLGGPGDDLCVAGDGSDGCWGGPGDDVCRMGAGEDGCHGEGGDDRLYGGPGADRLFGGPGTDYCDGDPGIGHSEECEAGPRH